MALPESGEGRCGARRKPLGVVLAALLLFALGIRAKAAADAADSEARRTPDVIRLATVNANYRVALLEIADRYMALNPGIQVEMEFPTQQFETWIRTRFAAGGDSVPDIYNVNYTSGYVQQGKLVFLDRHLDRVNPYTGTLWRECLDAQLMERYMWAGKTYQIPLDYIDIAMFYNKRVFREAGVEVPETWEEFMSVTCPKIQEAGYIPVAMAGDYESFWASGMGWLVRMFGDAYLRNYVPEVMSRPGDWDYDPLRNDGYEYDPEDPFSDLMVVVNQERMFNAVLNDVIDIEGPRFRAMYDKLREFAGFWQPGYLGSDFTSATQLFYRQRAAMYTLTSSSVTGIVRDFRKLDPEDRFEYGVFWFPPITRDPLCEGPFRGVGGAGVMYSVTQKNDPEHENNVVDFLMYLTTPESGRLLVETTLAEEQPLIGPILIQGVDLPEELASKFEPFTGHGFEKINFRGLADEQQSVAEWVSVAQQYFIGQIGQDEFLARYKQIMKDAVPRLRERFGYDLDPTTEDGPREFRVEKSLWNPFENGVLAVTLIALLFLGFGAYHVARARGAARTRTLTAYGLLLPTFLLLGTFSYSPALSGLYHAFTSWEEGRAATFTGLENFRGLVSDEVFWGGVVNMLILLTAGVIKATVIPFLAAEMILSLFRDRLRYFFRTAFLVPMVVPGMVGILIWRFIYDPNMGMLNRGLEALGLEQWTASWLGEVHLALPAIIFMGFPWVGALGLLIYMAGLMAVPESVYEAFALESDNVWRRIQRVDIPLVRGQTRLLIVLTFIQGLQDFQGILIMTGGGPVRATMVPALHMYYQAFRFSRFGYGAAIGFVLFVVILLATLINLKVLKPAEEL